MKTRFYFWATILIFSLMTVGLMIRSLALQGVPYSESLITRGFFSFILALVFGLHKGHALIPKALKIQLVRALLAGLALSAFTLSYNYLTASAVAVLSNIDVPLLIVLAPLMGLKSTMRTRLLALLSIFFLILYVLALESGRDLFLGLITLGIGSVLLCFGYLFIKKSMVEESEAVTIITPSLAIIAYGLATYETGPAWTSMMGFESFLSGLGMFGSYYATMRLYEETDLATAEFPTLLSSIFIQPIEAFFLNSPLEPKYLLTSGAFVVVIYFIMKIPGPDHGTA